MKYVAGVLVYACVTCAAKLIPECEQQAGRSPLGN